jgi:glycosyltransferase involved in cell wall biosynthesis
VVENKLEADFFDKPKFQFHKINQSYIIGIVGFFRYRNIIEFLNEFVKIKSDIKVHLYGDGPLLNEILTFVDQGNIIYFGQFKYPDDIPSIYNSIDLSFTMYDSDDLNVKLALPNKLYESIYFNVPILVSKNTFLSEKVDSGGIGFSWNQLDYYGLIQYLTSKRFISDYNSLESNFLNFDKNQIINETNHTRP